MTVLMELGVFFIIFSALVILSIFIGFIIWGIKTGQFKNIEDVKHKIFQDEEK